MFDVGEIVIVNEPYDYYMAVVTKVDGKILHIKTIAQEEDAVCACDCERATVHDIVEEIRCLYGFYN